MNKILMMTVVVVLSAVALAEAPLAGQAGSATLSRAVTPAKPVAERQTPAVAPKVAAPAANAKDAIKIGVIERLKLVGELSFLERENVFELLEPALCDGSVKTVGDLRQALATAKNALSARGYYLIYVFPARADAYDAATKTLELAVEPGRFGRVSVVRAEGAGNWYSDEQILKRFKYAKEGEPFDYNTLRQAIRAVNGHPDITADTKLSVRLPEVDASTNAEGRAVFPGLRYLDAELTVDDSFPLHATLDVNNYAMEELDYWQMLVALQYLNLTGADDVLSLSPGVTFNGEMWSIAGSYMRPFDLFLGGNWSVYGGYSDMDSDDLSKTTSGGRLDLEGVGGFAGLNTSWNLWDTERRNVALNLGLMWRVIHDQWTAQHVSLSDRKLHIVPLTAGFSYGDKRRDWAGGLDFLSLSDTVNLYGDRSLFNQYASDDATPNYTILRASWARLQPLVGPETDGEEWRCWSLFQKLEGQTSLGCELISAERLAYGGFNCLRGYRSRGYLGDSGIYGTTEFRTPVWCNPISALFLPEDWTTVLERIQFAIFSDYGYISYQEPQNSSWQKDEWLWSAGFGVRGAITRYLSVNFDCAFPLRDAYASDNDRDLELYFSIKLQY